MTKKERDILLSAQEVCVSLDPHEDVFVFHVIMPDGRQGSEAVDCRVGKCGYVGE